MKSIFLLCFLAACESTNQMEQHTDMGKCEDAVVELQRGAVSRKVIDKTKELSGSLFSYASTAVGYTTDVIVVTSEFVIITAGVCGPAYVTDFYLKGTDLGNACSQILGINLKSMPNPKLGPKIHESTSKWRCADLSPLSIKLRKIAGCFAGRNTKKDLEIAITQLQNIKSDKGFVSCVSQQEKAQLVEQLFNYQNKIQQIKI